jgi:hypothetical protein
MPGKELNNRSRVSVVSPRKLTSCFVLESMQKESGSSIFSLCCCILALSQCCSFFGRKVRSQLDGELHTNTFSPPKIHQHLTSSIRNHFITKRQNIIISQHVKTSFLIITSSHHCNLIHFQHTISSFVQTVIISSPTRQHIINVITTHQIIITNTTASTSSIYVLIATHQYSASTPTRQLTHHLITNMAKTSMFGNF